MKNNYAPMQVAITYEWFNPHEEETEMVSQCLVGGGYSLEGKNSDLVRVWGKLEGGSGDSITLLIPVTRIDFISYQKA